MKKFACILIVLLAVGVLLAVVPAAYAERTPSEVVKLWESCYGTAEMDRCGPITTAKMRNDKPESVWVYDVWKDLHRAEYRKEGSEVLKEEIGGEAAIIILQTRIYAMDGYVDQKEMYKLIKVEGEWLIDELVIGDEILEEDLEEL